MIDDSNDMVIITIVVIIVLTLFLLHSNLQLKKERAANKIAPKCEDYGELKKGTVIFNTKTNRLIVECKKDE